MLLIISSASSSGTRLHRGYVEEAAPEDTPPETTHIVFVVHGIGQKMDQGRIIRNTSMWVTGRFPVGAHSVNLIFMLCFGWPAGWEMLPGRWRRSISLIAPQSTLSFFLWNGGRNWLWMEVCYTSAYTDPPIHPLNSRITIELGLIQNSVMCDTCKTKLHGRHGDHYEAHKHYVYQLHKEKLMAGNTNNWKLDVNKAWMF